MRVDRTFGRLDILVNNAGIMGPPGPLHELAPEAWDQIFNTNLRGVYYTIRNLAPLMIRGESGHIINISSLAGKNALPNGAAYSASKWGLNGLTYSLAEELRAYNIRVSVICPGSVNTEFSGHAGKNAERMLQASRRRSRGSHDRDSSPAIIHERNLAEADAETVAYVLRTLSSALPAQAKPIGNSQTKGMAGIQRRHSAKAFSEYQHKDHLVLLRAWS